MSYVIRNAAENDAAKLFEMMTALDSETKYMMYEPDERGNDSSALERAVQSAVHGEDFLCIAEAGEEIVGYISAQRGVQHRIRHSAYIVVGIRQAHQHQGIGTRFFSELDQWARSVGIRRLELTVMCCNDHARMLYEKSGFEIEGIKKESMLVDGNYVDEYCMAKLL